MDKISIRKFGIKAEDYPIQLTLEAKDLRDFMAVVSSVLVIKPNGTPITIFDMPTQAISPLVRRWTIPDPNAAATAKEAKYAAPADLDMDFVGGFATPTGDDPRYELEIRPSVGDPVTRKLKPSPGRITIEFQYR